MERIECLRVYGQARLGVAAVAPAYGAASLCAAYTRSCALTRSLALPQASEYLYYQANKWDAAAPPAAAPVAPAAASADEDGSGSEDDDVESSEPDESELTVARIDAVVAWMRVAGVPKASIPMVLTAYPAVLAFDVEERLDPLARYMAELGVDGEGLANAIARRPSLLGLSVSKNIRLMVEYLQSTNTPQDKILEYLLTTL